MKANEFVKKFGWGLAKQYLNRTKNQGVYIEPKIKLMIHQSVCEPTTSGIDFVFHRDTLKRLVESWELVESFGGLKMAKESLKNLPSEYQSYTMTRDDTGATTQSFKLNQAIADVEACQ